MIPSPEYISQMAQDYSLMSNLRLMLTMIVHEPVREYEARVAKYKARTAMPVTPLGFNRLEERMANLEARQTLGEADLTLLEGLLERLGKNEPISY